MVGVTPPQLRMEREVRMKDEGLLLGQEASSAAERGSKAAADPSRAVLRVCADARSPHAVSPLLTGKFCEHMGSNIYNGMCAEVLRNPTFADFPFGGGGTHPDGGAKFLCDEEVIRGNIRSRAARMGWPEGAADGLVESRADGLAHWWIREGPRDAVPGQAWIRTRSQ